MATVCKLYRGDKPQLIPPNTWARNLRWAAITLPEGDTRPRQIMSRFIRDPHGIRDDTGADDRAATPGRSWQTVTWPFAGQANQAVGVEVWHDHHEDWPLEQAQFVGTTSDY